MTIPSRTTNKTLFSQRVVASLRDPLSLTLIIVVAYILLFFYTPILMSIGEVLLRGGISRDIVINSIPIAIRSLIISLVATGICISIAIPLSYLLSFYTTPLEKTIFIILILAPYWVGSLLKIYSLAYLLLVIENIIGKRILYTETSLYIGLIYNYSPLALIPIFLSMERVERAVVEIARSLGGGSFYILRRVIIPMSSPGITTAFFLVFTSTIGEMIVPQVLLGSSRYMIGQWIYQLMFSFRRLSDASLISILYLILTLLILILISRKGGLRGFSI